MTSAIDPDLDFASFYRDGGDPDRDSERLYVWHRALWSREVPGVERFELEIIYDRGYGMLLHAAERGEFVLGSDGIIPTWSTPGWTRRFTPDLVAEIARPADDFYRIASTIGGYLLFPRNRAGQTGWTLNHARGMHAAVADRIDVTLACIRSHFNGEADTPLADRLAYYGDFFALFDGFESYVRFFLLDDLLVPGGTAVRSLMTGEALSGYPVPAYATTPEEYAGYRRRSIDVVTARNRRISDLATRLD